VSGRDPAGRVLALDLGSKRVGVAVSDSRRAVATPHDVLLRAADRAVDHQRIAAMVDELGATLVVVGLPLSLDGTVGPAARAATEEASDLAAVLDVPVETYDERLTTVTAERVLADVPGPERRQVVDKVAAAVLLQSWLDGAS